MERQTSEVALSAEAERLYMNYALSVIMSRALPDVRDGLKPVQRRILFAMHHELHVGPDAKPAKCARIVGDVIGKYHPHGDSAVYEALVRMAQDWVMRGPLVVGQGNFGSLDGDGAAAYRYTEARLSRLATELLVELPKRTVGWRPSFDGTRSEPVVLPARFPNLLVNGAQGIAVGMATSIPPHNLGEVIDALELMIDGPSADLGAVLRKVRGPDFPTGGELLTTRQELRALYETGQGTLKVRGEWKLEERRGAGPLLVVTSIPYGLEKSALVEKIAEVIISKKLPSLVDVRDESTDTVRVVCELKRDANAEMVAAYLHKHTPLQSNVQVNLTCLVPSADNPDVPTPERLDLLRILRYFLDFRLDVVTRRLTFELEELEKRLHVLEGFEKVFDALDEIIKLIRASEGKADAAARIMKRFGLDEVQTDAILELKLHRLARLEILLIREEAGKKRAEVAKLRGQLGSKDRLWGVVKSELLELRRAYADRRRTRVVTGAEEIEYSAEDFIVDEDALVIVSAQGWVKRQGTVKDLSATRVKEGDRVLACVGGSTRATVAFFSSLGACYVARIADVPPSTGYGDPVQKLFRFADGERVVDAFSLDPRVLPVPEEETVYEDGAPVPPYGVAVTRQGLAFRFPLFPHREPSTRAGRRFARLNEGDEILHVFTTVEGDDGWVVAATTDGHAIAVPLDEIALLSGPGKGTMLVKLEPGAAVLAARLARRSRGEPLSVFTEGGKKYDLQAEDVEALRGTRGKPVVKRGGFASAELPPPEVPVLTRDEGKGP